MRTVEKIVEEQVHRWNLLRREAAEPPQTLVVTVSRQPGSGGRLVAQAIASKLGLDLFHQEVLHEMAKSARMSERMVQTLDERALSVLEDTITSLVQRRHLWPDEYLRHLLRVIGTIGRHGRAVVVGRGANFILPAEGRFRLRVVADRAFRARQVAEQFTVTEEEALRRIDQTDANRRAFVRKYFHADIADPLNYDMVINTGVLTIEQAADAVCAVVPEMRPAVFETV